jgi:hypothetical protein
MPSARPGECLSVLVVPKRKHLWHYREMGQMMKVTYLKSRIKLGLGTGFRHARLGKGHRFLVSHQAQIPVNLQSSISNIQLGASLVVFSKVVSIPSQTRPVTVSDSRAPVIGDQLGNRSRLPWSLPQISRDRDFFVCHSSFNAPLLVPKFFSSIFHLIPSEGLYDMSNTSQIEGLQEESLNVDRFSTLPAEIRTAVYELVLPTAPNIELSRARWSISKGTCI